MGESGAGGNVLCIVGVYYYYYYYYGCAGSSLQHVCELHDLSSPTRD